MTFLLTRYKSILLNLFAKLQDLKSNPIGNRLVGLEIQTELILRIEATERIIKNRKAKQKLLKSMLAQPGNDRHSSKRLKNKLSIGDQIIKRQNLLRWIYKSIGDSIAFVYGDRYELKQLAMKDGPGFITGKKGSRLERKSLRKGYEMGATLVLNDITNTLRHGDLTLFRPDLWPDGGSPFLLIEAKSGKGGNKERAERQKKAIEKVSDYLRTDKRSETDREWLRVDATRKPEHHFDKLSNLCISGLKKGWVMDEVEFGLWYFIVDINCKIDIQEILSNTFNENSQPFILSLDDDLEVTLGYYPYPLCFKNGNLWFRFINRELLMLVFIEINKVNQILSRHGLAVSLINLPDYSWQISLLSEGRSGPKDLYASNHMIGKLRGEFIKLDWLLENIISQREKINEMFQTDNG